MRSTRGQGAQQIDAAELLELWDLAQARPEALGPALLARALPELDEGERAALPIGRRDAALLGLRARVLGPVARAHATCPECQAAIELDLPLPEMIVPAPPLPPEGLAVAIGEHRLRMRLPTADDVAAAARSRAPIRALIERCAIEATCGASPCPIDALPPALIDAAAAEAAALDPQADLELAPECPSCGHGFRLAFDVLPFYRAELAALARRLAGEVAALARAYHWREADILAMSPARRQLYLELAGA